jgi:hypothetical protein
VSEDLARESIEAYNDGDWEWARRMLADDSVYDDPGTGGAFRARTRSSRPIRAERALCRTHA